MIDELYSGKHKGNYYLGLVSFVSRKNITVQVENLSLLQSRLILDESVVPNSIDYYVVIESNMGLFIGIVQHTGVKNSDNVHKALDRGKKEEVLPNISIDIIAFKPIYTTNFELPGFKTAGVGDKVYVANKKVIEKYLNSLHINREFNQSDINSESNILENIGSFINLDSVKFSIEPNTLLNRHLMVIGATGSGKSTSTLSILDRMVKNKNKFLIIDPTGEYKESFLENEVHKITLGEDTTISPGKLNILQWSMLFELNDNTQPAVLSEAIQSLRYQYSNSKDDVYVKAGKQVDDVQNELNSLTEKDTEFDLTLLAKQIKEDSCEINIRKNEYYFSSFVFNSNQFLIRKINYVLAESSLSLFFNDNSDDDLMIFLKKFLDEDIRLYIDSSNIGIHDGVGGMIVDLITLYLLNNHNVEKPFIFFLDEAHRYTKNKIAGSNEFHTGLISMAREGRKKGQYLLLTTQSPTDVSNVLLAQMGSLLIHRLNHQKELDTISNFIDASLLPNISKLGQGEAILSSVNLLQNIVLKMNESSRPHYNKSPSVYQTISELD